MVESPQIAPALEQSVGLRRELTFQAMRVFSGWGYRELQIPLLDYFDSVKAGLDADAVERTLRFVDRRGDVMMLRTDITPVITKILTYQLDSGRVKVPVRVSYANKIVRLDRGNERSIRESYQLGTELIGVPGLTGEIEVFLVALELLDRLGIRDYQFNVADHGIAQHLLTQSGAPSRIRDIVHDAIVARDPYGVRSILTDLGIRQQYVDAVATLADLEGGLHQLQTLQEILPDDKKLRGRLENIRTLFATLSALGYKRRIRIDMAELGGAGYYDGIAFNIVSETIGRSLGRGGRYSNLFENFGRKQVGIGFALSAEAMAEKLRPKAFEAAGGTPRVDEIAIDGGDMVEGFREALALRAHNRPARIVPEEK